VTYAIIGSGNIGEALARQFARSGIDVAIANSRGPESLAALARELGERVTATTLQQALRADVVILAVPYRAHRAVADSAASWSGKILIDAMNPFGVPPAELKGQASSDVVASAFKGAKVVKAFNHLPAKVLAMDPAECGGRRVLFVSSNDEAASRAVGKLLEALGFASIGLGKITEGGALLAMGGPLVLQNLIKLG
jgi:predicted dinucleotide-binding enzyme